MSLRAIANGNWPDALPGSDANASFEIVPVSRPCSPTYQAPDWFPTGLKIRPHVSRAVGVPALAGTYFPAALANRDATDRERFVEP